MEYGTSESLESDDLEYDDEEEEEEEEEDEDEGMYPLDGKEDEASAAGRHYVVLSQDEIAETMVKSIEEVNDIFQIDALSARALLVHFKWDKETLLERYYEGDPEKLMKEAHIVISPRTDLKVSSQCEICVLDVSEGEMCALPCGHAYCRPCWQQWLTTNIMDLGVGQRISCAGHNCDALMDELTVSRIITDLEVKRKYNFLMSKNFVEANRLIQWCPAPGCTYAVRCREVDAQVVECKCGTPFCFKCLQPNHEPVLCSFLQKWMKKCDDDSETSHWINANTKECPKCRAMIEKSGGCNHMICRNQSCKYDFCWVCLGEWAPHGSSWYNCNRFNEKAAEDARTAQEVSRQALARYLFYCDRYLNHFRSEKLEKKLYASIRAKIEEMQGRGLAWIESKFLLTAVDVLCQSRSVLKYSYVFAYYLKQNNQASIFLDNQESFEMATEDLSEYLERDLNDANFAELKIQVQDRVEFCRKRSENLLGHVSEGYEKDWWVYLD